MTDSHGMPIAANRPAAAASEGELDKTVRYEESVQPLALETYGHMGFASMKALRQLSHLLKHSAIDVGLATPRA
eukprot:12422300-Karenia_brevis.AAC.1